MKAWMAYYLVAIPLIIFGAVVQAVSKSWIPFVVGFVGGLVVEIPFILMYPDPDMTVVIWRKQK